jgi:hypothetical protein
LHSIKPRYETGSDSLCGFAGNTAWQAPHSHCDIAGTCRRVDGLPLSIQLVGAPFAEDRLLVAERGAS